ncbi:MAG: hypothetical protein ACKOAU_13260 [Pirellula sp.]
MSRQRALSLRGSTKTQHGCDQLTWNVAKIFQALLVAVGLVAFLLAPSNVAQAELLVYIKVGSNTLTIEDNKTNDSDGDTSAIVVDTTLLNTYFSAQDVTFSSNFLVLVDTPYDDIVSSWTKRITFQYEVVNNSGSSSQTVEVIATYRGANIFPSEPGFDRNMYLNASGNFENPTTPVTDPTVAKFAAIFDQNETSVSQSGNYTDSSVNPYVIGQDAGWSETWGAPTYNALRDGDTPTQIVQGAVDGLYSFMLASSVTLAPGDTFNTSAEASFLVPEPASVAMWGFGAVIVLKRLRRKK